MALERFTEKDNSGENENKSNWYTTDGKKFDTNEERNKLKTDLAVKVFCHRNSILTDLMKMGHLQAIRNIAIALFILLFLSAVLFYMTAPTMFWTDAYIILNASGKLSVFCMIWISLHVSCAAVFYVMKWWTFQRVVMFTKKKTRILDNTLLLLYVIYLISMITVPTFYIVKLQVPTITTFALLCEQTRIFMKIHSFVMENISRVLKVTSRKGEEIQMQVIFPTFHHFLYYFFAPTLLYRDSYLRTSSVRWSFVVANLLQLFIIGLTMYFVFHRFYVDVFQNVGRVKFTPSYLVLTVASSVVAGSLNIFFIFYGLLHCWMNTFAEIFRFADRLFYKDWWNSTSLLEYHSKWNSIVQEWIYVYVYMELQKKGFKKITAMKTVFLVSGTVHEFILSFTFRFFVPSYFLIFLSGVLEIYLPKKEKSQVWNIFMLGMLVFAWSCWTFFYTVEWYARVNCPKLFDGPLDYFVPRFLFCNLFDLR